MYKQFPDDGDTNDIFLIGDTNDITDMLINIQQI